MLVGVPTPEMRIDLPLLEVFGRGGSLKSSWYGDCLPSRDFPMLIDLYLQGRLPLDAFVTETIGIGDVEAAFEKMHAGDVLRSVVSTVTDVRIDHGVTSGTFSLDGETFDVDNNVWVVGNDDECLVIDAPHDVKGILEVVGRATRARRSCARMPTTTTYGSHRSWPKRSTRRSCCTPTTSRSGS